MCAANRRRSTKGEILSETQNTQAATFTDLGVDAEIVAALTEAGITSPFPIQAMAIPIALRGTDMIGQARTGTGKTLAFGIPIVQNITTPTDEGFHDLEKPGAPQALVVAPTRELAGQVSADLTAASTRRGARVVTVYGGVAYEPQLDALSAGVEIVVGTPGRLLDLMQRGALVLRHCRIVVLDEADEMLDLGFLPDVERILSNTPAGRQTLLFSATMPTQIAALARAHLTQPVNIRAESHGEGTTVPATTQFIYQAHDLDKPEIVARIMQAQGREKMMIFCRTKRSAQRLADDLAERGFSAAAIHGDLNQAARERTLKKFREGGTDCLVATDVAARGIDVTGVTHVINYQCPDDDKTYVHRIGRTGRAGASGVAVTFVDWADTTRWKVINKALGLPFDEPTETYSTSPHLFTDLDIPTDARSRLISPKAPAAEEGRERPRQPRPKSTRTRRRTRHGVVSEEATPTAAAEPAATPQTKESDGAPRRRRRRRSSSANREASRSDD